MANFGTEVASLSAPSGAGANVVAPVQEKAVDTSPMNLLNAAGNVFAVEMKSALKDAEETKKNTVVGQYSKEIDKINNALASGQMSPAAASARTKAINSKYAAGFAEYIPDFAKAAGFFSEHTAVGEAEAEQKKAKDLRADLLKEAQLTMGLVLPKGSSVEVEDAAIKVVLTNKEAEYKMNQYVKQQTENRAAAGEGRAVSKYEQEKLDKEGEEIAQTTVRQLASTNFDLFQRLGQDLAAQVAAGKNPMEAQAEYMREYGRIAEGIKAVGGKNTSLAAPYAALFAELKDFGMKSLDPKTAADQTGAQLTAMQNKLTMLAYQRDPKLAAMAVATKLFPMSTDLAIKSIPGVRDIITNLTNIEYKDGELIPPVVGSAEVEAPTLEYLRSSLERIKRGENPHKKEALEEASLMMNNIAKGAVKAQFTDPNKFEQLSKFLSSSEFGVLATEGKLDKNAIGLLRNTIEKVYNQTVVKDIGTVLDQPAVGYTSDKAVENKTIADVVDIRFNGNKAYFVEIDGKGKEKNSPLLDGGFSALTGETSPVEQLNKSSLAITRLIRQGAHMEGTTDYSAYWEKNKQYILPSLLPNPDKLKVGDVKNGYKYLGGNVRSPGNWEWAGTSK